MTTATKFKRTKKFQVSRFLSGAFIHKPKGLLHPRVQKASPEHFGIVAIDCAKARSTWMLCDFYGKVLIPPAELAHTRWDFEAAFLKLRQVMAEQRVEDLVVAIERTGNYHLPVKRAFASAGFECRIVHPYATKQFRQPDHPGTKTDEIDLAAVARATISGFGLIEEPLDPLSQQLQLLVRHRRDLVQKRSAVCCQIREHLDAALPGFANCFSDLWNCEIGLAVARQFSSPESIRQAGIEGLAQALRAAEVRLHKPTLARIVAWSSSAASPHPESSTHHRIALVLERDRTQKTREIAALEQDLVSLLVQMPYVLLVSIPAVNVVSAAELAGEMGPITNYANAKRITGRAGLFPSRYQSDQVDFADGHLIRCANRSLRAAILMIAGNLRKLNGHFRALADVWDKTGKQAKRTRIKIASRFTRIAYQMVAGQQVFRHPSHGDRAYILDKLMAFHREHGMTPEQTLVNLQAAINQIPRREHEAEAAPLAAYLKETQAARRRGPQPIGELIPLLLARLGASALQSNASGEQDLS